MVSDFMLLWDFCVHKCVSLCLYVFFFLYFPLSLFLFFSFSFFNACLFSYERESKKRCGLGREEME